MKFENIDDFLSGLSDLWNRHNHAIYAGSYIAGIFMEIYSAGSFMVGDSSPEIKLLSLLGSGIFSANYVNLCKEKLK